MAANDDLWHFTPPCPNTGQVLVQGAKRGNTWSPCLNKPVLRNTCCRHKPTVRLHDYKRVSNGPAHTPEHKSTWNYTYTNTFPPIVTLATAGTKPQTTFSIALEPQKRWFQKRPKIAEPCLDKPVSGRGGGGAPTTVGSELAPECNKHRSKKGAPWRSLSPSSTELWIGSCRLTKHCEGGFAQIPHCITVLSGSLGVWTQDT